MKDALLRPFGKTETNGGGEGLVARFRELLYSASFGLLRDYQQKTLELLKITGTVYYLEGVKVFRRHCLLLFLMVFAAALFAATLVATPFLLVAVSPWTWGVKMTAICLLGVLYAGGSLAFLLSLFSEERWMKFSGSAEFVERLTKSGGAG